MNPLEYKLTDEFILEGIWGNDHSDKKVYGTLTHKSNNTSTLKLVEDLKTNDHPSHQINIIGKIQIGGKIFVVKAYIVSVFATLKISGICQINHFVILKPSRLNKNSGKILDFDNFSFDFLHLKEWLMPNDYEIINEVEKKGIVFKNWGTQSIGNVSYKNKEYELLIKKNIISHEDYGKIAFGKRYFDEVSYKNEAKLEIKANKIRIEDAVEFCRDICSLFEILLEDYSKILYIGNSECNVFPAYTYPNRNINEHHLNVSVINSNNLDLGTIINNWIEKFTGNIYFHRLAANYLSDINNPSTLENTLLNLTQGIEMYYASEDKDSLMVKLMKIFITLPEKYATKIAKFTIDLVDNNRDTSFNASLCYFHWKKKKMYLNKAGKFLVKQSPDNIRKILNLLNFLEELKNTRVLLTHGEKQNSLVLKNKNLNAAVKVLTEVVRIFILLEIGISKDELEFSVDTLTNIGKLSINYRYDIFN